MTFKSSASSVIEVSAIAAENPTETVRGAWRCTYTESHSLPGGLLVQSTPFAPVPDFCWLMQVYRNQKKELSELKSSAFAEDERVRTMKKGGD